ncbi:unnamed protein product [Phaedon cochleariae]|uniref:Uncharacterized protein n=1 Tax=Phaedon cochleariae TaxID=80249 RepID=A0A9N9SH57_PHACE|nr:unnamed protein product [Phaedon cochleariae]
MLYNDHTIFNTTLPVSRRILKPNFETNGNLIILKNNQTLSSSYSNENAQRLPPLQHDQPVMMQKRIRNWIPGRIISPHRQPESYLVETNDGGTYRRNRINLKPVPTNKTDNRTQTVPISPKRCGLAHTSKESEYFDNYHSSSSSSEDFPTTIPDVPEITRGSPRKNRSTGGGREHSEEAALMPRNGSAEKNEMIQGR